MNKMILLAAVAVLTSAVAASAGVKENYDQQCKKCHGVDGKAQTAIGKKLSIKDFTDAKVQSAMKEEKMTKAIKEGIKDGDTVRMKPAEGLKDDEIKALVEYVRAFKK